MKKSPLPLLLIGSAFAWLDAAPAQAQTQTPAHGKPADYSRDVLPLLKNYCWDCHGDGEDKGGLNLDKYGDEASILTDRKIWAGVQFHIEQWTMPPAKRSEQPTPQERELLTHYLDHLLNPVDPDNPDPGRVTTRRLNRVEYNNTVRDLLGVDIRPADDFPEDDTGYGFDNIGDVLSLSPILMERYLIAADRVLAAAIPPPPPSPERTEIGGEGLTGQGLPDGNSRLLAFNGSCGTEFNATVAGEYIVRAKLWASPAGDEPAKVELLALDSPVLTAEVLSSDSRKPDVIEARVNFAKGFNRIGVKFLNDFYDAEFPEPDRRDRNISVLAMEVEGPFNVPPAPLPDGARKVFAPGENLGETDEAARAILQHFAYRSFRRTVSPEEVDRLMQMYRLAKTEGEPHQEAIRVAMKMVMVSPSFLFRIERPVENTPADAKIVDLDDFALASRLSYWLWSTMPDEELLSLATRKELRPNLPAQVDRMIKDPKIRALAENFAGQWLELRTLAVVAPDKEKFPEFTPELARDMRTETEELFHYILTNNRSVFELLSADYTFVNERLANFYGIPGVKGNEFRKVQLDPKSGRQGILTHAGILTLTSDPTRTSPVKRGKWVLENLLGIIPPPPPPNVPALEEDAHAALTGTVRQRLEAHRNNPGCASCHALIDPIGFGLENFDPIGRWRDKDGNFPVDTTGTLTTGQTFKNAQELAKILQTERQETFLRAFTTKMLVYALGRGPIASDMHLRRDLQSVLTDQPRDLLYWAVGTQSFLYSNQSLDKD